MFDKTVIETNAQEKIIIRPCLDEIDNFKQYTKKYIAKSSNFTMILIEKVEC